MATTILHAPLTTPIVELTDPAAAPGTMTKTFAAYLNSIAARAQAASVRAGQRIVLTGQTAAIVPTLILPQASGLYRVEWRFRVRTPATTNSSLALTITTTDDAVTVTQTTASYTGNDASTPQSGVFIVRADPGSPLSYSTAYGSTGATPMTYDLDVMASQL